MGGHITFWWVELNFGGEGGAGEGVSNLGWWNNSTILWRGVREAGEGGTTYLDESARQMCSAALVAVGVRAA